MSNTTTYNFGTDPFVELVPVPIRFWLMLFIAVPSFFLTLFLLYYLISDRDLRLALHNHVTIILLIFTFIYEIIDIPLNLIYFKTNTIWPSHPAICLIMWMIQFGLYNTCEILVAWASFERHILIFYQQLINTRIKRIFFHYLPIISILMYTTIFYTKVILFSNCQNRFDYNSPVCGGFPCYQTDPFLAMVDIILHTVIPTISIGFFSLTLFLRVIIQKQTLGRQVEWRRYRKMFIQLILLSSLHFTINFPLVLFVVDFKIFHSLRFIEIQSVFFFVTYFLLLLQPFVILHSIPDIGKKLKKFIPKWQRTTIVPTAIPNIARNGTNIPVT